MTPYPASLPLAHVPLVLSVLRGQEVDTREVAKALWEVTGYGLNCVVGEPGGPLAARASEPAPTAISVNDAIDRLERLSAAAAADESQPQGMSIGISRELVSFLLTYLANYLMKKFNE